MPRRRKMSQERQDDNEQQLVVVDPITPVQQSFIELLLTGKTIAESALLAGVSRRAATYWLHDTEHPVRREYELQRARQRQELSRRVSNIHGLALTALEDLLSPDAPVGIRFQTFKLLYENHLKESLNLSLPVQPAVLVEEETQQYFNSADPQKVNGVYLYDDQGRERLQDD